MGQESREAREEKNAIILEVVVHIEMVYNLKLCMEREGKKEGRQEGRKGGRHKQSGWCWWSLQVRPAVAGMRA